MQNLSGFVKAGSKGQTDSDLVYILWEATSLNG